MSERISFKVAVGTLHLENIRVSGKLKITDRQRGPPPTGKSGCKVGAICSILQGHPPPTRCPAQLQHFYLLRTQMKPCGPGDVHTFRS